jgi:protein-disulfide isomerase
MIATIFRVGLLTALVAVVACGEAPPPPAAQPVAQAPVDQQGIAVTPLAATPGEAPAAARGAETDGAKGRVGAPAGAAPAAAGLDQGVGDGHGAAIESLDDALVPADLVATGAQAPPPEGSANRGAAKPLARPPADTTTVWRVPIAGSPIRGDNTALVTMVMFSGFQCPFCVRAHGTVAELMKQYGGKLRVVHKNNPMAFHKRSDPAAQLALEARAQKGDAGYWKAVDLLFAQDRKLEDSDLEAVAKGAGMDVKRTMAAIAAKKHAARIEQDQDLAYELNANGTPQFFINGRRLVGSQSIDKFTSIIDEEIVKADALIKKGTAAARIYDALQKDAKAPPPLLKVKIPAPTKDNPSRGPANAKVVVQVFAGFQCPFCKKLAPTIRDLEAAFPGKIRVVWRQRPLSMHANGALAAEASVEAFKQKGAEGFWKMHDLLFEDQTKLDRPNLDQAAATIGLDPTKFAAALDGHTHQAAVNADGKIADAAKINGTPTTVINGYLVTGAQPLSAFQRVVKLALKEAR